MTGRILQSEEDRSDLERLVTAANGMLPMPVYHELYELAGAVSGGNFVEVGTAHGAATIAIALGAGLQTREFKVWTVDQLGGYFSSRRAFGSPEENAAIILENFRRAKILDCVRLFVGSAEDFIAEGACPKEIDFLLLDADGRIDRDLAHFYIRMLPGAPIVIDDVDSQVYLSRNHDGVPFIDLKHRISSLLLNAYEEADFIRVRKRVNNTAFCERGSASFDPRVFSEISTACYRELVFATVDEPIWNDLARWKEEARNVRLAVRAWEMVPRPVWSGIRWLHRVSVSVLRPRGR